MSHPRHHFIKGDICDASAVRAVFRDFRPDAVLHLAAETHVDRSIFNSDAFIQTNVLGTHVLLEASLRYFEKLDPAEREGFRFLMVSTDEVFGSLGEEGCFTEASRYEPRSPYSASKASADHLARAWGNTYGLPVIVSNCSNNYGPCQNPEKLIPRMVLAAIRGEALPVYGKGANIRDWLHVNDHADALILLSREGVAGETYCIGGGAEKSNLDVVTAICRILDDRFPERSPHADLITFVKDRPGHDFRYALDHSKMTQMHGWQPNRDFETGLIQTVDWYLNNESWWRPLLNDTEIPAPIVAHGE